MNIKEKEAKVEELSDKIVLIFLKMQKLGEKLGDELHTLDKQAIETHKEYMKKMEELGPIIKELVDLGGESQ